MSDIKVKSTVKRVENETTKKQAENLKASKAKIEEQNKKIAAKREKNKEATQIKEEPITEENKIDTEQVVNLASKALGGKKKKGFFSGLIIGIVIGLVLGIFITTTFIGSTNNKGEADEIINETPLGYTAVDFKNAILGESIEKQDLIVMEQPLTIETTITKAGLGNLEIFSKIKKVNFAGKGVYTVDLSGMNETQIEVDEDNQTVTIYIPHATLHDVVADFENTSFEDTEKGLLAFGDLSLTLEDQNELEKSVQASMKEELSKQELLDKADEIAKTKTWELFSPLVEAVSDEYLTIIEFK